MFPTVAASSASCRPNLDWFQNILGLQWLLAVSLTVCCRVAESPWSFLPRNAQDEMMRCALDARIDRLIRVFCRKEVGRTTVSHFRAFIAENGLLYGKRT